MEGGLKGMDTYNTIKINQDGIEIEKIIRSVCHLQENKSKTSWHQ